MNGMTTPPRSAASEDRPSRESWPKSKLRGTAYALLGLFLPIGMALANKSAPLWLSLAAAALIAAAITECGPHSVWNALRKTLSTKEAALAAAFFCWAALSLTWSSHPVESLRALGEVILPVCAAVGLATLMPGGPPRPLMIALSIGFVIACACILIELKLGYPFRNLVHARAISFALNRPTLTLLLMYWPLLQYWRTRGRAPFATGLGVLLTVTVFTSTSGASKLGLAAGILGLFLSKVERIRLVTASAALVAAFFLVQPIFGKMMDRVLPESFVELTSSVHSRARIDIWKTFGEIIQHNPLGTGFGTAANLTENLVAQKVSPELRSHLNAGHPHNNFLQIWVELGIPGVAIALLLWALVAARLHRFPRDAVPERVAFLLTVASIALLSHGAWQGWWIAAIGFAIVLFRPGGMRASLPRDKSGPEKQAWLSVAGTLN
jgi:O-antigen ligase